MATKAGGAFTPGGYWGRVLLVNLATGEISTEEVNRSNLERRIGGYGLGAEFLLARMPSLTHPFAEESLLGFFPGPLTGIPVVAGTRFTVVAKSPLTMTWGDANCGGGFGASFKQAGFDGCLIRGVSTSPVYLHMSEDGARLLDASGLWGQDTYATEAWLRAEHGPGAQVACIGPAGEARSLTAAIISENGRAAARSGLGAVMGAKRLKAVVAIGSKPVPISDPNSVLRLREEVLAKIKAGSGSSEFLRTTGTPGYVRAAIRNGDAPMKNWAGTPEDFPGADSFEAAALNARRVKRYSCRRCAIGCGGFWQQEDHKGERLEHRPEYETIVAFGPLCLNADVDAIARANSICNRYGLDTISTGAAVAFAIECFERGYLSSNDLDGLELRWGDGPAIVRLTEMIARREAFGAILADGLREAQAALHGKAEALGIHIRGEALPMHDPRFEPGLAAIYALDPTPARHTQANQMEIPPGLDWELPPRGKLKGRGRLASRLSAFTHVVNSSGMCLFAIGCMNVQDFAGFLAAVTGLERGVPELEAIGMEIADLRHEFNEREGVDLSREPFPARALGIPPAEAGPWKGVSLEPEQMTTEFLDAMGWKNGRGSQP